jgi:hypothetical protein
MAQQALGLFVKELRNKPQAVSQGAWRFGKRSILVNM